MYEFFKSFQEEKYVEEVKKVFNVGQPCACVSSSWTVCKAYFLYGVCAEFLLLPSS